MNSPLPGRPGSLVGHHIRLDRAIADTAQIVYCTVGILLRQLVGATRDQAFLLDVTHVIVDEVHERDVQTDFLLTLLRAILPRNPHLRLILMSATASINLFENYFAAYQPVVLNIPGIAFPIETKWLADCERLTSRQLQHYQDSVIKESDSNSQSTMEIPLSPRAIDVIDNDFILKLIGWIIQQQQSKGELSSPTNEPRTSGAILVFLPGKAEIEALFRILIRPEQFSFPTDSIRIHKLHSRTSRSSQQSIFEPTPSNTVKIILSTNIAETSLTIPDISHVIDTGRVKESRYNPTMRIKELVTVWTSQASANQRAGRAGRTNAGVCYKLYSQQFFDKVFLAQTSPEMVHTPLDELILQLCLLYEQRRDTEQKRFENFPKGANPLHFLSQVPEPPPVSSIEQACQHLLDVDALHVVETKPVQLFRLTPLGFHLSRLPMDAKVGKTLIVGCILGCLDGALTIAATLSCSRSCFYDAPFSTKKSIVSREEDMARQARASLVENGFGGKDWKSGTVKGDLIAAIACYRAWSKSSQSPKGRYQYACQHALDHVAMQEIEDLREQYLAILVDTGFVSLPLSSSSSSSSSCHLDHVPQNEHRDDALLTSCCLVAGLYPNVCTLMRPRKGGPKGGRLLTKEGDICRPHVQSFQRQRVDKTAEVGKDVYAMYHSKHRTVGTGKQTGDVVLSEVNFVTRCALLLFGGELEIEKNALILDRWLKFKVGEKSLVGAVIFLALRDELDAILLQQISFRNSKKTEQDGARKQGENDETKELMTIIRQLLVEE
jgi:HrpA-like RNA helicase